RVLKVTVGISSIAILVSGFAGNWHGALGVALGALIGILNLVWLHQGAEILVRRMFSAGHTGDSAATSGPSKLRVMLFFPLRYFAVIAAVYAILKGYPGVLVSFIVGLALPMMGLMGEGVYEAVVLQRNRPRHP
ncbi:MAG TPA: ATP synthase subunit I, partial [Candidatus Sulfotelmatobacter sp.]|nr:ATP synthase subunit I [Candidatus Sulfotelmatobacter sp.]